MIKSNKRIVKLLSFFFQFYGVKISLYKFEKENNRFNSWEDFP